MSPTTDQLELRCRACGVAAVCGPAEMLQRLRQLGMFRRSDDVELDVLTQLIRQKASQLGCGQCGQRGLTVHEVVEAEWGRARCCQSCGKALPRERLELFPAAVRCASCQQKEDAAPAEPLEFCPKCGSAMTVRPTRGRGITRYVLFCDQCRR